MPEINGVNLPFIPAGGMEELRRKAPAAGNSSGGVNFEDLFNKELGKLKFSGHAQTRMISGNIELTESEKARLVEALEKAESKGAKDVLALFPDKAFIVNLPNRTVITAVANERMKSDVFTNIDSAVLA